MKKIIIIIVILIILIGSFFILNQKENVERCIIGHIDKNSEIQEVYVYDITNRGIFNKQISNIEIIKSVTSFDLNQEIITNFYEEFETEGKRHESSFSDYSYSLKSEEDVNLKVVFESVLNLQNKENENYQSTEYNDLLNESNQIDYDKLINHYKDQGALCDNIKNFQ